ncbi:dimethylmenaquinone methyltransferase [Burkholderia latens]|uniref:Putative 4-hydroxy-4-methyl-2-oxoglutarate aldolase n=1 Tax=Burkholderia latens TaxID=488446 RepID=A0AAP1C509_9BURK|nr:dimethylmenaquinone methyltransferase [Burkholderia latens]
MEPALLASLRAVSFPTLGHLLEEGFADPCIHALLSNVKVVGRAVTLQLHDADALAVNQALAYLDPGDVLVIDMRGDHTHAPVGAVTACAAACAGAEAIVVDGAVTDILELRETKLPVFARGTSLLTTKRVGTGRSQFNVPVRCGGALVKPGDLVLADDNGVMFIDTATARRVVEDALASDQAEPNTLARLRAGEPVARVLSGT